MQAAEDHPAQRDHHQNWCSGISVCNRHAFLAVSVHLFNSDS